MNDFQLAFIGLARPFGGAFGVPVEDLKEGFPLTMTVRSPIESDADFFFDLILAPRVDNDD